MKRIRLILSAAALTVGVLVPTGCHETKKEQTQKEKVTQQWNQARAGVMFILAKQQFESTDYEKARKTLDDTFRMDPKFVPAWILLARITIEQGQLEVAEKALEQARTIDPKHAEAEYYSGVIYQRWQKPQVAAEFYKKASEKAPTEVGYVLAQVEMLVAMDKQREAMALLGEKAITFEHSAAIRDAIGQLLVKEGKYAQAVESLREASILATDDLTIREHFGLALYYAKQYREATDVITRLTKDGPASKRADLWAALGECQMQTNNPRAARSSFETASQLNPASAGVWLSLGKAALALQDLRRAELCWKKALAIDPTSSEANLLVGYLRVQQQKWPEALSAFTKANQQNYSDTVSLCMMGFVHDKMGHSEKAVECYSKALKLNPKDEMASKLMASIDLKE